jgi:predicted nucleic acid-binding protein
MIAVDTNIVTALLRGEAVEIHDDDLFIPFMVYAECLAGIAHGSNPLKFGALFQDFAAGQDVTVSSGLPLETTRNYADIYAFVRKSGKMVSPNDLWIAAECMSLALPLLTRDKDFDHIPQIIKV